MLFKLQMFLFHLLTMLPTETEELHKNHLAQLSQIDPRFRDIGLFSKIYPERAYLCGPTCLYNALSHRLGLNDPTEFMRDFSYNYAIPAGVPHDHFIENGIGPRKFTNAIEAYLQNKGIKVHVSLKGLRSDQPLEDISHSLAESFRTNKVTILNYLFFKTNDASQLTIEDFNNDKHPLLLGGHYVLLKDLKSLSLLPHIQAATFSDPLFMDIPALLQWREPQTSEAGRPSLCEIHLKRSVKAQMTQPMVKVLTGLIEIEFL